MGRLRLRALGFLAVLVGLAAPAALADSYDNALKNCAPPTLQPFAGLGDAASYYLIPNGAFETGANSWSFAGGAGLAGENEPFYVNGASDGTSLRLPAGASATSAPVCVTRLSPTMRFFARGAEGAQLRIDVVFKDARGVLKQLPVARIAAPAGWSAVAPLALPLNPLSAIGASPAVGAAFVFTASKGTVVVDDVYVDPLKDT